MKADLRNARRMMLQEGKGAYWQGKGLQRNVKLMDVFEQQGHQSSRSDVVAADKGRKGDQAETREGGEAQAVAVVEGEPSLDLELLARREAPGLAGAAVGQAGVLRDLERRLRGTVAREVVR